MIPPFFLSTISKALNAYLLLDPESKTRLQKLQGKIITIELLPFHFIFQCDFSETGVQIYPDAIMPSDTTLSGTPLQLMNVMLTKENRHRFFADDIKMEGNAEIGQQVIQLFDELIIDWEECAAKITGDVPAHQMGRLFRCVKNWLNQTEKSVSDNINEYLHEETTWFPTRECIQDFFNEIDTLRMDVDRLEARLNQLREELA